MYHFIGVFWDSIIRSVVLISTRYFTKGWLAYERIIPRLVVVALLVNLLCIVVFFIQRGYLSFLLHARRMTQLSFELLIFCLYVFLQVIVCCSSKHSVFVLVLIKMLLIMLNYVHWLIRFTLQHNIIVFIINHWFVILKSMMTHLKRRFLMSVHCQELYLLLGGVMVMQQYFWIAWLKVQ